MKHILFVVIGLWCSLPSVACSSVNPSCTEIFGDGWTLSTDADAFHYAEFFLSKLDEPHVPVICVGHDDLLSPARTLRSDVGPPWTLYVGIDDRFLRDSQGSLRGLLAHEIAHYAFCYAAEGAYYWASEDYDSYQRFEEGVDRVAAHWTHRMVIADALRSVYAFAVKYFPKDASPRAIPLLEERIHILDYAQ